MKICLYAASSSEISEQYITETELLGEEIANRNYTLIFGAGANGLMGAAARGALNVGGKVIGVAPEFFKPDGVLLEDCTKIIYTQTMRQRKKIMEDESDAFIMAPGGIGTFDEFFEILTLKQLGQHGKPIAVFNINGYYNGFIQLLENSVKEHFLSEESLKLFFISNNAVDILNYLENYRGKALNIKTHKS